MFLKIQNLETPENKIW